MSKLYFAFGCINIYQEDLDSVHYDDDKMKSEKFSNHIHLGLLILTQDKAIKLRRGGRHPFMIENS